MAGEQIGAFDTMVVQPVSHLIEQNEFVYKEILGYSDEEVAQLLLDGVITTEHDIPDISKLEDRLDRLESALGHRQSNLSKLEDMRDSAWSDSYRDRVDDWISDEHERIAGIERKIDQIKSWISDMEAKLR